GGSSMSTRVRMALRRLVVSASVLAVIQAVIALRGRAADSAASAPKDLQCESLKEPLGMDVAHPRFSWKLADTRRGAKQSAYEIQVASSDTKLAADKPDVWDSGKIVSEASLNVPYAGPALGASRRYYWRVRVWDKDGKPYPPSAPSWCET